MSVSLNSDADRYTRFLALGTVAELTVTCWVKLASNRATTTVAWQIDNGSGGNYFRLNFYDGDTPTFQAAGPPTWFATLGGVDIPIGDWYFIGLAAVSTGTPEIRWVYRADGSNVFTPGGSAQAATTFSAQSIRIGGTHTSNQFIDGSMCSLKVWDQALTQEEMREESWGFVPRRTAGLRAFYPFLTADTIDYSGNGQTLTAGTATTDTGVGPALPWGAGRRRIVIPAAVTSKSLADAGSAAESLAVSAAAVLAQSGAAADALSATVGTALADAGSAAQSLAATATVALSETASGADLLSTGVPKAFADGGSATQTFAANATVPLAQAASAAESLTANVTVALTQSGSAADALTAGLLLAKTLTDSASATESLSAIIARDITGAGAPYMRWAADAPEVRWSAGQPYSPWAADSPTSAWSASPPSVRYSAGPPVLEEV